GTGPLGGCKTDLPRPAGPPPAARTMPGAETRSAPGIVIRRSVDVESGTAVGVPARGALAGGGAGGAARARLRSAAAAQGRVVRAAARAGAVAERLFDR